MSLVPFKAFVDPSGRLGPLCCFSSGPACGLLAVRREPTGIHWSSPSSSTVGAGGGADAGAGAGADAGAESKIKVLFVCTGGSALT
jgi:hypothetical protein